MITGVNRVGLQVADQTAAKAFWSEKVGFRVVTDLPYDAEDDEGPRWIELQPPDDGPVLVLAPRGPDDAPMAGRLSPVLFECDDIHETHRELAARGVEFANPPTEQMWGWSATFKDPEGALFVLNERA